MIYPMKLKPATKDYVWGGTRLKREWKKPSEGDVIAESWELSCHNDGMSVIENGEYAGMPLGELLEHMPLYKGEKCGQFEFFPILIKLIDAKTNFIHTGTPVRRIRPCKGRAVRKERDVVYS